MLYLSRDMPLSAVFFIHMHKFRWGYKGILYFESCKMDSLNDVLHKRRKLGSSYEALV